jgi:hypothetical protein
MIPSEQQRESFGQRGWLVLRNVVPPERLADVTLAFDRLMSSFLSSGSAGPGLVQLPAVCRTDDVLLRHLREGLAEFACHLIGARAMRLLQDTLLLKAPSTDGAVGLHQDYTYTGYLDSPATVSISLALTDAAQQDGCVYVVDGSHKWGLVGGLQIFSSELQQQIHELSPHQRRLIENAKVPLEVRGGDVTIHHCLTFHGSYPNTRAGLRKNIVTHLFDGDCRLVRARLPREAEAWFETDGEGRVTGERFPELYVRNAMSGRRVTP